MCREFSEEINESGYHPIRFTGEGCLADRLCSNTCPVPGAILVVEEAAP